MMVWLSRYLMGSGAGAGDSRSGVSRGGAALAASRAFGHGPVASGRIAMAFGDGVPVPVNP